MTLLIKNALCFIADEFKKSDVFITDGIITEISSTISSNGADRVIDALDKYFLIPGFVDVHTHLRQPGFSYKETIKSGSMAGARAGYTALCTMPNLNPAPDCPENLKAQTDIIERDAVIDVLPFGTITKGRKGEGEVVDFESMADKVVGFSDDGTGVQTGELMEEAMVRCAKLNKIISAHCEVNDLLKGGYIHDGVYCREHGHKGICSKSEWAQIERDCKLAEKTGCRYHVCHISTKESVDIIRKAKARGVKVTCETGPHYLTMCDEDLLEDGRFKMNPPLRTKKDVEALKEGLRDNIMDVISTDHAPHTFDDKNTSMKKAPFGIVGLETAACLTYTELVLGGYLTPMQMAEKMSYNPAKIIGIDKGDIQKGKKADVVIFDPKETYKIDKNTFASKGRNTPFDGREVTGRVKVTICDGNIVYGEN